ncbi:MAG: xanthine dehydrogenase family protein subunit M [Pseudomonadota bacterium]
MHATNYYKATSASDAANKLDAAEDGMILAGGQTLIPTMKARLAAPSDLVALRMAGLTGITRTGTEVTIGAMTTHAEVGASGDVPACLAALARGIGDPAVRHRGTIGGSVANNDPAADYPAACLALGATIVTNIREIPAADYFQGMFDTALDEGEVITAIRFPDPERGAYAKFPNPASRYAMVGVFVAQTGGDIRVAVTGAGESGVFRHAGIETALAADFSAQAVDGVSVSADGLLSDLHGDAEYRAALIKAMAKRAVEAI